MNLVDASYWTSMIPILIIIGVVFVLFKGITLWRERNRNAKAVIGNMLVEFWTAHGTSYEVLCRVNGQIATPPKKGRPGLKVKVDKNYDGEIEAPEGHGIGKYLIINDCVSTTLWPRNRPKFVQFSIRKATYREGIAYPQVSIYPEKHDDYAKIAKYTATVLAGIADDNQVRAIQQLDKDIFKDMTDIATNMRKLQMILIVVVIACAIGIATGFLTFQIYSYLAG